MMTQITIGYINERIGSDTYSKEIFKDGDKFLTRQAGMHCSSLDAPFAKMYHLVLH